MDELFVGPADPVGDNAGTVLAIVGNQPPLDIAQVPDAQMQSQRRTGLCEVFQRLVLGHIGRLPGHAGQDDRLRDCGQGQLDPEGCRRRRVGRNTGRDVVGNIRRAQPPRLLRHRAIERRVARVHPRHPLPGAIGGFHDLHDLVQRHRG